MRKITAILMIALMVLMVLVIAGCKKHAQAPTSSEDVNAAAPVKELPETKETTGTLNEAQEIESDINDEGVKNLDQELDEINW